MQSTIKFHYVKHSMLKNLAKVYGDKAVFLLVVKYQVIIKPYGRQFKQMVYSRSENKVIYSERTFGCLNSYRRYVRACFEHKRMNKV